MTAARVAVLLAVCCPLVAAVGCDGGNQPAGQPGGSMILATTTSLADSGLLDVLVPLFRQRTGVAVKVIAVGTGAALAMAARGDADAVLVHAPASEQEYVAAGHLVGGRAVMANGFVIVGPPDDPAGAGQATSLAEALAVIARTGPFISRGDGSGTHQKEVELFAAAGIDPGAVRQRQEAGQGMGATLNIASERRGYTLTDLGTYLALRASLDLAVVFEGDRSLQNVYTAYIVNPAKHREVRRPQAEAFIAFLAADDVQALIGSFGRDRYGEALFVPVAGTQAAGRGR